MHIPDWMIEDFLLPCDRAADLLKQNGRITNAEIRELVKHDPPLYDIVREDLVSRGIARDMNGEELIYNNEIVPMPGRKSSPERTGPRKRN